MTAQLAPKDYATIVNGVHGAATEGDVDLRGFLGISERVRKGFGAIPVRMLIESAAGPSTLIALAKLSPCSTSCRTPCRST